jgi:hypothetical protein
LRLKFIRDFDLRRHPHIESDDLLLRHTDYRDGREICEPSYGEVVPLGLRERVTTRLIAKLFTFDALEHDRVPAVGSRALRHYRPAVGGAARSTLPAPSTLPRVDIVYDDDSVFAWYK